MAKTSFTGSGSHLKIICKGQVNNHTEFLVRINFYLDENEY